MFDLFSFWNFDHDLSNRLQLSAKRYDGTWLHFIIMFHAERSNNFQWIFGMIFDQWEQYFNLLAKNSIWKSKKKIKFIHEDSNSL